MTQILTFAISSCTADLWTQSKAKVPDEQRGKNEGWTWEQP